MMIMPYLKRIKEVAAFNVRESMALLITRGIANWRKSTNRRHKIPMARGHLFRVKYSFNGRKLLSVWRKGNGYLLMIDIDTEIRFMVSTELMKCPAGFYLDLNSQIYYYIPK